MVTGTELGHSPTIAIGGAPLGEEVAARLEAVTVDLAVGLPGSATLRFRDPDLDALDAARLKIGATLTVGLNRVGEPRPAQVFDGEVTALEYEYDARGAVVVARCHDLLHRLTRGRRTRSWVSTDEARVARNVLAEAGVPVGTVEGADLRHEHVAQLDVSDWEFLSARARDAGRVVVMLDGKAHVRARPTTAQGTPVELVVGRTLERLRVRVTSAGQVRDVSADGWDPQTQRPVAAKAAAASTGARSGVPQASLARPFRAAPVHVGSPVLATAAQARARARGVALRLADAHAEVEGSGTGDPRLLPGTPVAVKGTGPQHDGTYVLTRVQHVSDREGYRTRFECGGGEDRTLRGLLGGAGRAAPTGGGNRPVPGVTVGVVTDVKDPVRKGRVKVKYPWLTEAYATDWVRVAAPGAGPDRGAAWLPEVNDEVLVAFDHGDTRTPYVLGGLWSGRNAPPQAAALVDGTGKTAVRALQSRTGQRLVLSDELGKSGFTVATGKDAVVIRADETGLTLAVSSKGTVAISGMRDVSVTAAARLLLEGTAGVQIKGATVAIDAQGPVSVTGAVIRLN